MKKYSSLIAALLAACSLSSQTPANDDCAGLKDLGTAPVCTPTVYSNVNATASDIGDDNNPSCFNGMVAQRDVWFVFTCPDTLLDFRITLTGTGNSIKNPQFAVYRGDCAVDGLAELLCAKADPGENSVFLDLTGLTAGAKYYIRVSDYSQTAAPNWGEFTLCVDKIPPVVTIDQGSSVLCEGTLYDSGGPDDDYDSGENYTFVICPNEPSACITFTLEYYNIEIGSGLFGGDALTFYDGNSINAPILGQLKGGGFVAQQAAGGGVSFQVQATSGCLTVQFTSDGTVQFEGWKGKWACSALPCPKPEGLTTDTTIVDADIVNAIATPLTAVTVTKVDCKSGAYGTFSFPTDNNDLGLKKGLIMTSGFASIAGGPNDNTGAGMILEPGQFDTPPDLGDPDLNYLSQKLGSGSDSYDACIVELDVFAGTDELVFEYVFGSEEYPEYVNSASGYNDIFAFLISGPGIAGDPNLSNNARNIAVLPGTGTPVQIDSVNNLVNWQYYRNNQPVDDFNNNKAFQYDGLTSDYLGVKKSLTARAAVIPCNTYHLKLAIADRGDEAFDSGVFISEIKAGTPTIASQFASGLDYLTENCSGSQQDFIVFSIPQVLNEPISFKVTLGGTATLGADYTLNLPDTITFQPGETQLLFVITPINDNIAEGSETITIQLSNDFGCGNVILETLTTEIKDNVEVVIGGGDTLLVCAGGTLQLQAEGAAEYFWKPPGLVSDPVLANPTIKPAQSVWLEVTGKVGACVDVDSVFIQIVDPEIDVVALSDTTVCTGTPVFIQANNNVNNAGLTWTPATDLNDPNSPQPVATPSKTTTYTATVSIAGCSVSDKVTILIDTLFFPDLIDPVVTVCQNYPVQLATPITSTTKYKWIPSTGLDDPMTSGPIALPDVSTTYTLTATSANGYCSQTASVTVNIIPADVNILGDEYEELCLGDTILLTAQASPPGAQVQWSPSFYVSNATGPTTVAEPDESVTIIATYNINNCIVYDSVRLRVDSLPEQAIVRVEDKTIYCPGDTVYLISQTYEPAHFPDIQIEWQPFGGLETPVDLWNMVITAIETHTYERVVVNNGCRDTARVEVPVGVPPTFMTSVTPPQICPGESAQILVTVNPPGTALEWDNMPPTLDCTTCPNPKATPLQTTTYSVSTPDADCPSGTSVTVEVLVPPALNVPASVQICPGGSVQLNNISEQGVIYNWTPATGLDDPTSATPTATLQSGAVTYMVLAVGPKCTSERTVTVTVASATIDAGENQTVCFGEKPTLTAVTTGTIQSITWQPGNFTGNPYTPAVAPPLGTTAYMATLVYGPNCTLSDGVNVTVVPGVSLSDFTASPDPSDSICLGSPITLQVTVTPPNATIVWLQNGTALSGFATDSVTFIPQGVEGSAEYMVTASNTNGCTDETELIRYNFKRCTVIPNAFSPGNNDAVNDTFGPVLFGGNTEIQTFQIYNRWGAKVFEATPQQQRWDGKKDGKDMPSDVYAYYIVLRYADGTEQTLKGDVTLLR